VAKPPQLFPPLVLPVEPAVALSDILARGGGSDMGALWLSSWFIVGILREEICGVRGRNRSYFANGFRKLVWCVEQMDLPGLKRVSRSEYLE